MPMNRTKVLRDNCPSKESVRDALAADWTRAFPPSLRGTAAEAINCNRSTLDNGASGKHLPELHTALATLLLDPTALQTVFRLYGVKIVPLTTEAANDLATVSNISHLAGQWTEALADGRRDHRETCELAQAIRPILPALSAIVAEADRVKGVA